MIRDPCEELLRSRLASSVGRASITDVVELGLPSAEGHPAFETLVLHAAGELEGAESLAVSSHLARCPGERCAAIMRDAVASAELVADALYPVSGAFGGASGPRDVVVSHASVTHAPATREWGEWGPSAFARERNTPTLPRAYLRPDGSPASRPAPRAPASRRPSRPGIAFGPGAARLTVVLEGERHEVTKDRFVVGRGAQASDLVLDDPRVSRQHALIEHAGGSYFLVDMGSTNGVEHNGERIARKEIADGDRVRIGDHELEFRVD